MSETVQFCKEQLMLTRCFSPEELYYYLSENTNNNTEIGTLFIDIYDSLFKPHIDALEEYCTRESVYRQYLKDYYGNRGWFVFHRKFKEVLSTGMIDVVASMIQKEISYAIKMSVRT